MSMRMKTKIQMWSPKPADSLLKTSKNKDIELSDKELGNVAGGGGVQNALNNSINEAIKAIAYGSTTKS
jgi:hypothetical protein